MNCQTFSQNPRTRGKSHLHISTVSQAFEVTTTWYCVDWRDAQSHWSDSSISNECGLPHLIAPDIPGHQWLCIIAYFEGFVHSPSVFCCLVGQTSWPLFRLFIWNIHYEILIYWSCFGDWQPGTLVMMIMMMMMMVTIFRARICPCCNSMLVAL